MLAYNPRHPFVEKPEIAIEHSTEQKVTILHSLPSHPSWLIRKNPLNEEAKMYGDIVQRCVAIRECFQTLASFGVPVAPFHALVGEDFLQDQYVEEIRKVAYILVRRITGTTLTDLIKTKESHNAEILQEMESLYCKVMAYINHGFDNDGFMVIDFHNSQFIYGTPDSGEDMKPQPYFVDIEDLLVKVDATNNRYVAGMSYTFEKDYTTKQITPAYLHFFGLCSRVFRILQLMIEDAETNLHTPLLEARNALLGLYKKFESRYFSGCWMQSQIDDYKKQMNSVVNATEFK